MSSPPSGVAAGVLVPVVRIVDADVRAAVAESHLHALHPTYSKGSSGAVRTRIPAGSVTHREGERTAHLELVISGLVRVFVAAPAGRTMTVRYCRPGALIGVASLFAAGFALPAAIQPLVDAEVLRMSPTRARHMAERDVRVALGFLAVMSVLLDVSGTRVEVVSEHGTLMTVFAGALLIGLVCAALLPGRIAVGKAQGEDVRSES